MKLMKRGGECELAHVSMCDQLRVPPGCQPQAGHCEDQTCSLLARDFGAGGPGSSLGLDKALLLGFPWMS